MLQPAHGIGAAEWGKLFKGTLNISRLGNFFSPLHKTISLPFLKINLFVKANLIHFLCFTQKIH